MPYRAGILRPPDWIHPDKRRLPPNLRGYGYAWRKLRARILERDPVCVICHAMASDTVDHIVTKARGGTDDESNLRGLCRECHSRKTAKIDARWGKRV
jgi:5-methylcytosine-specific restriction protein A